MTAGRPLSGQRIGITRPIGQAWTLAAMVRAAGGEPLCLPLLEIGPPPDAAALTSAAERVQDAQLAVFISANAVHHALPAILAARPKRLPPFLAPGPGTVAALRSWLPEHTVWMPPENFDSEAMLALPALQQVAGWQVMIFRGTGGRELLAQTLQQRGAQVDCVSCYQRHPGDLAAVNAALADGLSGLVITSSEALGYLVAQITPLSQVWQALPLFVAHDRVENLARQAGFTCVNRTAPGDAGLLAGIAAYFNR